MEYCTVYFLTQTLADMAANEGWLTAGERARAARLRFPKRHSDWLLGRWTAKQALRSLMIQTGRDAPDYRAIELRTAPDGAPEAFWGDLPAPVSLALSHSNGRGLCVLARAGIALGCDLEEVQLREVAFLEDYFCDEEKLLMKNAPSGEQPLLATLIWSAKESALKCLREGLRRDTRSVLVDLAGDVRPGWSPLSVRCPELSQHFHGWWRGTGGCVQTVAAGVPVNEPVELRI
ncbi:MAG: 4'-phosphopantetheinyl transferase superfamily protein [Acidobacteriia bacterium]|nr:4'-phosphopantetheinyl transferase superfamily protein [Terriglobia bacterium]